MSGEGFVTGARLFTVNGAEVEYVGPVADKHAAYPVMEDGDGGEFVGDEVHLYDRLFQKASTERVDSLVSDRWKEYERIGALLRAAREEEAALKATASERAALLAQHRATARIADFIAGKITHFVVMEYGGPVVMDVAAAINIPEEDGYGGPRTWQGATKLLTLYGASGRNTYYDDKHKNGRGLEWRLSTYSDGSGGSTEVIPCMSEAEARGIAAERIAALFADATDNGKRAWSGAAKAAEKLGIEVPAAVREHLHAEALRGAREWLAKTEASAAEARAKLAAIEAQS